MKEYFINSGYIFIKTIEAIKIGEPLSLLFNVLDAIKLENNYHLGLRLAKSDCYGDKSWFYCYEGGKDKYIEIINQQLNVEEDSFFACFNLDPIYDIFEHLIVEKSERGVWQAYLLSKATTLLPITWHGAYLSRQFIFNMDDLKNLNKTFSLFRPKINFNEKYNVSPIVSLQENNAEISACYWNDWSGLVRESVYLSFTDGKVCFINPPTKKTLYKFRSHIIL